MLCVCTADVQILQVGEGNRFDVLPVLIQLFQFVEATDGFRIDKTNRPRLHRERFTGKFSGIQFSQPVETIQNILCDADTWIETFEPAPATLVGLQLLQMDKGSTGKVVASVRSKNNDSFSFVLLRWLLQAPRGSLPAEYFSVPDFSPIGEECFFAATLFFPGLHHGSNFGI